jgi:FKBP-type peptidyl-prolyl cis-trans isomerase
MLSKISSALVIIACLALSVAGCGSDSSSSESAQGAEGATPAATEEILLTAKPGSEVDVPSGPPPKDLVVREVKKGSGPKAKSGDEVEIAYAVAVYSSGKVFSVARRYSPFTLKLGSEGGVKGLEQGIIGMKVGSRRELIVPPRLGYPDEVPSVPRHSTFVFVVELVGIN